MRNAFINQLTELACIDDRLCLIVGDLGYSVVERFAERFPERFLNAGVAEQNMIGVAAGWSLAENKVVFVYSIGNFPTLRCVEQIRNDVCHHNAAVVIVAVGGGLAYGTAGFTHYTTEDLAVMKSLPGMIVSAPADAEEAAAVTRSAVESARPFYIRLGRNNEPPVHHGPSSLHVGEPIRYNNGAGDIIIFCTGPIASEALKAADLLAERGLRAVVFGMPFLKPVQIDKMTRCLEEGQIAVSVEEHSRFGGVGSILAEAIAEQEIHMPLLRLHLPEFITRIGTQQQLRRFYGLDAQALANKIEAFVAHHSG